jgi:hypothetical protein
VLDRLAVGFYIASEIRHVEELTAARRSRADEPQEGAFVADAGEIADVALYVRLQVGRVEDVVTHVARRDRRKRASPDALVQRHQRDRRSGAFSVAQDFCGGQERRRLLPSRQLGLRQALQLQNSDSSGQRFRQVLHLLELL